MQSIPGYPTDFDVAEPSALVTVNGVPYDVESLTVTRELSSNLPDQVTSASGYTAATGSVEWAVGEDVQERAAHPWDGNNFPPKPSDAVVAFMGYGDTMARQLTGVVDRSDGSIAEGAVSSEFVDHIDKLNQPVTFPAHLRVMPPHDEGGALLQVGNEPTFTTDRILRACGFHATPRIPIGCVLSAPLMGSSWPEVALVTQSWLTGNTAATPSFSASHWGVACSDVDASYTPAVTGGSGKLDRPFQMTFKVKYGNASSGESLYRAYWGADFLQLSVAAGREVRVTGVKGGTATRICTMATNTGADADVFTLTANPSGTITLNANNGVQMSGLWSIPATMSGGNLATLTVRVPSTAAPAIGGILANFGLSNPYLFKQTASLTPSTNGWSLPATPRIDNRGALDVLKEQAEAECAAMWIDEQGVFQWVNRSALTLSAPVATLTPLDVLDIGWESSADGVRSKVVITSDEAAISRSNYSNKTVWQGSGGSLDPNQEDDVQLVEPGSDEDWVGVDESVSRVTSFTGWLDPFNRGRQSWWGGVEENDTDERWANLSNPGFSMTVEKVGEFGYRFTTKAGTPTPGYTVELRTAGPGVSPGLRRSKIDFNLPVLRAKAIVEWSQRTTTGATLGPANAAALEHHVGPWVQDPTALQNLADWLAAQVSEPRPVLRDLNVIPDFRRQLGDVVWVEDPDNMRIRLKVLLTKISTTVSTGDANQTIAGQILQVQSYGATSTQLDAHAGNKTNTGFDTLWAGATNAQLDANPLGRG